MIVTLAVVNKEEDNLKFTGSDACIYAPLMLNSRDEASLSADESPSGNENISSALSLLRMKS